MSAPNGRVRTVPEAAHRRPRQHASIRPRTRLAVSGLDAHSGSSTRMAIGARRTSPRHSITILIVAAMPGSSKRSGRTDRPILLFRWT